MYQIQPYGEYPKHMKTKLKKKNHAERRTMYKLIQEYT